MTFLESKVGERNEVELAGSLRDFLAPALPFLNLAGDLVRFGMDTPDVSASPPLVTGEPMNSLRSPVRANALLTCLPIENEQIVLKNKLRTNIFIDRSHFSFIHGSRAGATCQSSQPWRAAHAVARRWADCDPSRITDGINNRNITDKYQ